MIVPFELILIGDFRMVDNGGVGGVVASSVTNIALIMILVEVAMGSWFRRIRSTKAACRLWHWFFGFFSTSYSNFLW